MKNIKCTFTTIFVFFIMQAIPTAKAVPPTNKAIIVLDASGSMHKKIDGKSKIDIARDVIDKLLKGWDTNTELGITAYGHRARVSCKDVETIVPVSRVNHKKVMSMIRRINPKGTSPISAAVRAAAEEAKYTEGKATVILVSDGRESCNADPCLLAKELEKNGVDFTIHVIGFDISNAEKAKLSCLAENTGGQFLQAKNAIELSNAMEKTAEIAMAKSPPTTGEANLRLHAVLKKGADPLTSRVKWTFYEGKADQNGKRKMVKDTYYTEGSYVIKLPAGRYFVEARYGNIYNSVEAAAAVQVKETGLTEKTLNLNAGMLNLEAVLANGGTSVNPKDIRWKLYTAKKGTNARRKLIGESLFSTGKVILPAGKYIVEATYGNPSSNITATTEGQVIANGQTEATVVLNAGYLNLKAVLYKGAKPIDEDRVKWKIYEAKKGIDGKGKLILSQRRSKSVILPAGKYIAEVNYGQATASSNVTVKADRRTVKIIDMNAGSLSLNAALNSGAEPLDRGIQWQIYEAKRGPDGNRKRVNSSFFDTGSYRVVLPEGSYFVEAKYEKVSAGKEIKVKAGELTKETMVLPKK